MAQPTFADFHDVGQPHRTRAQAARRHARGIGAERTRRQMFTGKAIVGLVAVLIGLVIATSSAPQVTHQNWWWAALAILAVAVVASGVEDSTRANRRIQRLHRQAARWDRSAQAAVQARVCAYLLARYDLIAARSDMPFDVGVPVTVEAIPRRATSGALRVTLEFPARTAGLTVIAATPQAGTQTCSSRRQG